MDTPGIEPGTARITQQFFEEMLSGRDNQLHHVPVKICQHHSALKLSLCSARLINTQFACYASPFQNTKLSKILYIVSDQVL